jgi:hypothetical protein
LKCSGSRTASLRRADAEHLAAQRDNRHPEAAGIDLRQLGNIVGDPALAEQRRDVVLDLLEDRLIVHR